MPLIVTGVGKKRIKEICKKCGLNWKEEDLLSKILQGWDKVVDKADKLRIVENYVGEKDCEKVIKALIQINREYDEKMKKFEGKRNLEDNVASSVRG